ncbi:TRAP transporter small permease subunit [Polynucleobacter yangtzensis]|uniref:TRAP transporter small permease subunit n=1 Tax=Polynucleobacter yangtzensis TaxID=1743159 RepID=UPI00082A8019|nr:TRAP transporter small permease subunit [Polynucleobacter yangtzensis]
MSKANFDLNLLSGRIDRATTIVGNIVGWMIIPMILSLAYEVVARYVFGAPTIWAYDMTFMLYGAFFMLGASYTLKMDGHIRTDMFYDNWSPRTQAIVDLVCYLFLFYPFVLIFTIVGWEYFYKAFITNERFVSSPWMSVTWPFKFTLPLTGFLLSIQGVSEVCKCLVAIRSNSWPSKSIEERV